MYTLTEIEHKCSVLRERFKDLKKDSYELLEEITGNIGSDINICLEKIGALESTLKNTYEIIEEQNNLLIITISRIKELENQVDYLMRQINGTKFFSTYRDWVDIFMDAIIDQLGERTWRKANNALGCLRKNLKLTNEERECLKKLTDLLKYIDMTIDDIKLLHEVKSKSNIMFHCNNQDLGVAKNLLNNPIPNEVEIYKPPIKKMLEKIDKLRSKKVQKVN